MIQIPRRWEQWGKALLSAVITGFCNAVLSSLGIAGAQMVGIKIPNLEWHQVIGIGISGGFIGALAYLQKSPVPPDSTGDTVTITKQQNNEKTNS